MDRSTNLPPPFKVGNSLKRSASAANLDDQVIYQESSVVPYDYRLTQGDVSEVWEESFQQPNLPRFNSASYQDLIEAANITDNHRMLYGAQYNLADISLHGVVPHCWSTFDGQNALYRDIESQFRYIKVKEAIDMVDIPEEEQFRAFGLSITTQTVQTPHFTVQCFAAVDDSDGHGEYPVIWFEDIGSQLKRLCNLEARGVIGMSWSTSDSIPSNSAQQVALSIDVTFVFGPSSTRVTASLDLAALLPHLLPELSVRKLPGFLWIDHLSLSPVASRSTLNLTQEAPQAARAAYAFQQGSIIGKLALPPMPGAAAQVGGEKLLPVDAVVDLDVREVLAGKNDESKQSFFDLPREIRDLIYGSLFSISGEVEPQAQVLQVCRQMYNETLELLYKNLFFHIKPFVREDGSWIYTEHFTSESIKQSGRIPRLFMGYGPCLWRLYQMSPRARKAIQKVHIEVQHLFSANGVPNCSWYGSLGNLAIEAGKDPIFQKCINVLAASSSHSDPLALLRVEAGSVELVDLYTEWGGNFFKELKTREFILITDDGDGDAYDDYEDEDGDNEYSTIEEIHNMFEKDCVVEGGRFVLEDWYGYRPPKLHIVGASSSRTS